MRTENDGSTQQNRHLVTELRNIKQLIGRIPDLNDIRKYSGYHKTTYIEEFGSIDSALKAAFPSEYEENGSAHNEDSSDPVDQQSGQSQSSNQRGDSVNKLQDSVEEEIRGVSKKLEKLPTITEFEQHSEYSANDIYNHFDSWQDAIDAADPQRGSRQALIDDLQSMKSKLGFIPHKKDIEEHGRFSVYEYQHEFGGVENALVEANLDRKSDLLRNIQKAINKAEGKPTLADFEAISPYNSGEVYKFFEGWDEAITAAKSTGEDSLPETPAAVEAGQSQPNSTEITQNELSERYELLRNLRTVCQTLVEARDDRIELDDPSSDPMTAWVEEIESFWQSGHSGGIAYGEQQANRNPFSMREYREQFGDGERVTEFNVVQCRLPSPSIRALIEILEIDSDNVFLPVDQQTESRFPVLVESEEELEQAITFLKRLPSEPAAALQSEEVSDGIEVKEEGVNNSVQKDSDESDSQDDVDLQELLTVNGITESIAQSLHTAGYSTQEELENAELDELAQVDGLNNQIAMRIKLNVGG